MKKSLYFVVAAFALFTTFVSCASAPAESVSNVEEPVADAPAENLPVTAKATADGIELKIAAPAGTTNVQIIRKDLVSNYEFICGMVNFSNATSGENRTYVDYFVEPNKAYAYSVKMIKNWNWNNPEIATVEAANGNGGKGLLTAFEKAPTYNPETKCFENMKLNIINLAGFNTSVLVNANNNSYWLNDDGGYNIFTMGDGSYFSIDYILGQFGVDTIDGITIRVGVGVNTEDNGAWIIYNGIPTDYVNGKWN